MNKNFLELIKERVVLFDGAMGTQLIQRGLQKGQCPEMWNLKRPEDLREIHKAYYDAGADVATTNTFGANPAKLADFQLQDRMEELNRAGVALAKSVCPPGRFVAGDMGPTGLFLPPVGKAAVDDFKNAFEAQANVLAQSGVDFIIIETQYDLREAVESLKSAKSTKLPVIVTMTFDLKKRGFFTIMGDSVEKSLKTLEENGADVVGANCTLSSEGFIELTRQMRKATSLPVIVQPNAGQPQVKGDEIFYDDTPEKFAYVIKKMVEEGANPVGSCCGSTPEFIKKIAETLDIISMRHSG